MNTLWFPSSSSALHLPPLSSGNTVGVMMARGGAELLPSTWAMGSKKICDLNTTKGQCHGQTHGPYEAPCWGSGPLHSLHIHLFACGAQRVQYPFCRTRTWRSPFLLILTWYPQTPLSLTFILDVIVTENRGQSVSHFVKAKPRQICKSEQKTSTMNINVLHVFYCVRCPDQFKHMHKISMLSCLFTKYIYIYIYIYILLYQGSVPSLTPSCPYCWKNCLFTRRLKD